MHLIDLPYHEDPLPLFEQLLSMPDPMLLHSADRSASGGRFDIMSAAPRWRARYVDGVLEVGSTRLRTGAPLSALRPAIVAASANQEPIARRPFCSGFIGTFGYPLHQTLERLPPAPEDPTGLPALSGGWYDWSVVTDHDARTTRLAAGDALCSAEVAAIVKRLSIGRQDVRPDDQLVLTETFRSGLCRDAYAWSAYRRLVHVQAAPFSAFLGLADSAVLSFSPERFLRLRGTRIDTCPIKGTAPRGNTHELDERARRALTCSAKDLAENLMIVDLLRNDLGKVCEIGSVEVDALFDTLTLPNVHHLVSRVRGTLRTGVTALDALAAAFPGGSITGAPKVQAMRIINALEPVGRSAYCGAIGYIDAGGNADLNIAIRTLVVDPERIHCWGRGGIVADSQCHAEWNEIDHKVGRLMRALASH